MAKGILSKNLKLSYTDTSAGTYTQLKNLISVGDLGNDGIDQVEVTDLESSSHEFIGGLGTIPGSIEFQFNFDGGETDSSWDVVSAWSPQTKHYFKVEVPEIGSSTSTISFAGYAVAKLNGATYNEGLKFTLTVIPTGTITVA